MSVKEKFGELRSFLERKPSSRTFDLIIQALEAGASDNEAKVRAEWLPYAQQRLESWPDHTRLCPKTRNAEYTEGNAIWHSLVRALDFEGEKMGKSQMDDFLAAPGVEKITCLDMRSTSMTWEQVTEFAERAPFELERFGFRRTSGVDSDALTALFTSDMLSRCRELNLKGWDKIKAAAFDALIPNFPLQHLRVLDLTGGATSIKRLQEMLDTGKLEDLEELYLGIWVSDKRRKGFIDKLVKHGGLSKLRVLHVEDHKEKEITALAKCEAFGNLEELCLFGMLSTASLEQLLESPNLESLRSLRVVLDHKEIKSSLAALRSSPALQKLERLHVTWRTFNEPLERQDYIDLFESPNLANLTHLSISLGRQDLLGPLLASSRFVDLEELIVNVRQGDGEELAESCKEGIDNLVLTKLTRLALMASRNTGFVLDTLKGTPFLGQIKSLRLQGCDMSTLNAFFDDPVLGNLEMLDLSILGYAASQECVPAISQAKHLDSLHYLLLDSAHRISEFNEYCEEHGSPLPDLLHIGTHENPIFELDNWIE
jgi:hypothetical protein